MTKDEIIAKLIALRGSLEKWLENPHHLYFDPLSIEDLFERYATLRDKLRSLFSSLFEDMPIREIPKSSGTTDFDGRGYFGRKDLDLLLKDVIYCLDILTTNNKKATNSSITDNNIKKLTLGQLIRRLSIGAWLWIIGLFCIAIGFSYNLGFKSGISQIPANKQEISLGVLTDNQTRLVREIWKYQKSNRLNKVIINKNGFIFDDAERKETTVNLALKVLGNKEGDQFRFENLMLSVPEYFLKLIPETRLGSPYVVTIPEKARKSLDKNFK